MPDGSDDLDPDLLSTVNTHAWLERRCAFPLAGAPPAPDVPWEPLWSALRQWKAAGLCDAFFFVRKPPGARWRFSSVAARERLDAALDQWLSEMSRQHKIVSHAPAVYEPEEHRFGGAAGMAIAHSLWSADAESVLEYECLSVPSRGSVSRALVWALAVNDLLRVTLDDTAEIWDVWRRFEDALPVVDIDGWHAEQRGYLAIAPSLFDPSQRWLALLRPDVRRLVDRGRATNRDAAHALRQLTGRGELRTGRRAWLAANVLFQANRWGLGLRLAELRAVTRAMEHLLRPDGATASSPRLPRAGTRASRFHTASRTRDT